MAVESFEHEDGRTCTYNSFADKWFHWDENPIKGPREVPDHECDRQHPGDSSRYKVEKHPAEDGPIVQAGMAADRGDFGMPTLGVGLPDTFGPGSVWQVPSRKQNHDDSCVRLTVKPTTGEAIRIIGQWLPETMERFLQKNTNYNRAQTGHDLGAKGIIPDINRKSAVLVSRIWHGDQVQTLSEDTVEVIDDLIGHLFLLKDKIMQAEEK